MIVLILIFWSFFLSMAVVWYTLTPLLIAFSLIAGCAVAYLFRQTLIIRQPVGKEESLPFKKRRLDILVFLLAYLLALLTLFFWAGVTTSLETPWQGIFTGYLPVFFLLTVILGLLLLAPYPTKTVLILIILHTLLQHLYLPAAHVLPWGGDVWRHIAVEEKLVRGEVQLPVLFGSQAKFRNFVPEALLIPHKYAYGQLWGVSAALALITRLPLLEINRWLMPILWSFAVPILLFQLALVLFHSERRGLALAFLPAMSFPFQALGALTLPVSFGFLVFLFALLVWLRSIETGERPLKILGLTLAGFMVFGYSLYFFLIWAVIGVTMVVKNFEKLQSKIQPIFLGIAMISGTLLFPIIDLLGGGSRLPDSWNAGGMIKQFVGQFSGWYFASAIRPHDFLSGNIFFNHVPSYAFVPSIFLVLRWWMIPAMLLLWGIAVVGFLKSPRTIVWRVLRWCGLSVFVGYVIGWYVLEGDRLFTRRLDLTLAFFTMIFFLQGMGEIFRHVVVSKYLNIFAVVLVLLFAWFATATYASGPDLRVVSRDEYEAAISVWKKLEMESPPYCVLADTWVLLPLEAVSAGKIVGGGFPIDAQFGQPERVRLYEAMKKNPSEGMREEAKKITGASDCIFIP